MEAKHAIDGTAVRVAPVANGTASPNDIRLARAEDAPLLKHIAETAYAKYVPRMAKPPSPFFYDYGKIIAAGNTYVTICCCRTSRFFQIGSGAVSAGSFSPLPKMKHAIAGFPRSGCGQMKR